jgi:hypothetical protein
MLSRKVRERMKTRRERRKIQAWRLRAIRYRLNKLAKLCTIDLGTVEKLHAVREITLNASKQRSLARVELAVLNLWPHGTPKSFWAEKFPTISLY